METVGSDAAVVRMTELLEGCAAPWLIGGSMGLRLRGAELESPPRDIDLYADSASISELHGRLGPYALDKPEENETERYRSVLSHYRLGDFTIELVGGFHVSAMESLYVTEVNEALYASSDFVAVGSLRVGLVPLAHELIFNLLRGRADRTALIGEMMRRDPQHHRPMLIELLDRNKLAVNVVAEALRLAAESAEGGSRGL